MTGKTFVFYDLVSIHFPEPLPRLERALSDHFRQTPASTATENPSIVIRNLQPDLFSYINPSHFKNPAQLSMVLGAQGQPLVLAFYHGRLDMVIEVGPQLLLYVADRNKNSDKFIHLLLICILVVLSRHGALLFKGAVVEKDGQVVTLVGASGAGKTSILLQLLGQGWNYLSDNTFLSRGGTAYLFRRNIVYHAHHILAFPTIFKNYLQTWFQKTTLHNRDRLRLWALRILPHYLLNGNALRSLFDPYFSQDPKELFPNITILAQAEPRWVVILYSGPEFSFEQLSHHDALRHLVLIHKLAWSEFDEVNRSMELFTGQSLLDFGASLAANLPGKSFFRAVMPWDWNFERRTQALLEQLRPHFESAQPPRGTRP